jgi:hypothetical protein
MLERQFTITPPTCQNSQQPKRSQPIFYFFFLKLAQIGLVCPSFPIAFSRVYKYNIDKSNGG